MTEKKKFSRFYLGMLIYALVFILLAALGLFIFWKYMAAYEYSRSDSAMERYMLTVDEERIKELSAGFIAENIDKNIQSQAQAQAVILDYVKEGIDYAKVPVESIGGKEVYALMLGDKALGRVVFVSGEELGFGFSDWQVSEEYLSFDQLLKSTTLKVPTDCTVTVNGFSLTEDYITARDIPYDLLSELYDHGAEFPTLVEYTSGSYIGDVPIIQTLADGTEYEYRGEYNEVIFADNCDENTVMGLSRFFEDFLYYYVRFTSGVGNKSNNYYNIIGKVEYDSDLWHRIGQAAGGMHFTNSMGDSIKSMNIDHMMDLGNGYQVSQLTYLIETKGFDGLVTTINTQKVLTHFIEDRGEYRAVAMASISGGLYEESK